MLKYSKFTWIPFGHLKVISCGYPTTMLHKKNAPQMAVTPIQQPPLHIKYPRTPELQYAGLLTRFAQKRLVRVLYTNVVVALFTHEMDVTGSDFSLPLINRYTGVMYCSG